MKKLFALLSLLPLVFSLGCSNAGSDERATSSSLQDSFDHLGPTMRSATLSTRRTVSYLDEGEEGWQPVVFVGGSGTSGRVFALLEFLRTTRENLQLRVIAVERNGFGVTGFDDALGYEDYAEDVEALLVTLGIEDFSLFAISGGGPYSAVIASRNAERLMSVHMAAALTFYDNPSIPQCILPQEAWRLFTEDPVAWFSFGPESPVHRIPGFQDAAFDDAARTFNMGGQSGDTAALYHELQLYCQNQFLPDLAAVTAPLYLYYGDMDDLAPPDPHAARWQQAYTNAPVKFRLYPGEGHDVQYRHLDQVLVDLAGMGDKLVICDDNGSSALVDESAVAEGAFLGLCAWR
ncbi:MAG: alpha/beta hydrolase [Halioglobus sp.]|nr:alpha/beta hydrolase [Halioglobus sp.]